jgi:hypothetical protein
MREATIQARMGRPPRGRGESGQPVVIRRDYKQLSVRVRPDVKRKLALLGALEGKPLAYVIESLVDVYVVALPTSARSTLENCAVKLDGTD